MPVDKTFENEVKITNDDRGRLDLTKQLETKDKEIQTLQQIIINLKNIIDVKEAEITTFKSVNESHKKLNGELRQEIQNLKKQADDMLLYPWFYLVIQYIENTQKKIDKALKRNLEKQIQKVQDTSPNQNLAETETPQ